VTDEKWDATTKTLSGRSKLVGQDAYGLRIVTGGAKVGKVAVSDAGVTVSHELHEPLLRVKLESSTSREVSWTVQFK